MLTFMSRGRQSRGHAGDPSRRLVLGAAAATAFAAIVPAAAQDVLGDTSTVTGAGSTFAYPILSRWAHGYQRWIAGGASVRIAGAGLDDPPTQPALAYEPIGSLAGTLRVRQGAVDFGASDVPMRSDELAKLGLGQFPFVIGGVVVVVNVEGVVPGTIKLNGPLLADIFVGKVQSWSDPAIKALNIGLALPDARIAVVRRSDGSGTTFNFTDYLSKASPYWKETVGAGLQVTWPTGSAAKGNDGVARMVRQTRNSIGYLEYTQARQAGLSYARLQNAAGHFIAPDTRSFQVAAAGADWAGAKDFHLMLTDARGEDAYPIAATAFALMPKAGSPRRTRAALLFFQWALERGAPDAAQLGYVPLPPELVERVRGYWLETFKAGS